MSIEQNRVLSAIIAAVKILEFDRSLSDYDRSEFHERMHYLLSEADKLGISWRIQNAALGWAYKRENYNKYLSTFFDSIAVTAA